MNVSDYDYDLPQERIALYPPAERGSSRLLVLSRETGNIAHRLYKDLPNLLEAGDTVIINDTKVIKARLMTLNKDGKQRELLLVEKHGTEDNWHVHKALHRGSIKAGDVLTLADVSMEVVKIIGYGIVEIRCDRDLLEVAHIHGTVPLPPYMKRDAEPEDIRRYQTEFARDAGSVAAPTASLNLTQEIIDKLTARGIVVKQMTLHVGMGTFLPIRSDTLQTHKMHKEYFEIPADTIQAIRRAKKKSNRVIPIGTTVTRALEYAADDILKDNHPASLISGEADIFIYPGYSFKVIDGLVTNFHAPRSTVLMMAAALAGWDNLKHTYEEAISTEYTFLSYGDSMLIL